VAGRRRPHRSGEDRRQMEALEQAPARESFFPENGDASCTGRPGAIHPMRCVRSRQGRLADPEDGAEHLYADGHLAGEPELTEAAVPGTPAAGDDDGEYFCRVLLASEGVRFVPDARVYYRASEPAA